MRSAAPGGQRSPGHLGPLAGPGPNGPAELRSDPTERSGAGHGRFGASVSLILVALNLRMAIAAIPPVLGQIQRDVGLGSLGSGLLTALPLFCFGIVGPGAPVLARRLRTEPVIALVLGVIAVGCALRLLPSLAALFLGTAVIGAGIAVANVLLPGLIKRDFAGEASTMTAVYAVALFMGAAIPVGLTVPLEHLAGVGWRPAVAVWGVGALAAMALWMTRGDGEDLVAPATARSIASQLRRDRVAWAVTVFFGLQSLGYYAILSWLPTILESHGMTDTAAGWMLSYATFPGIAAALATPVLRRQVHREDVCVGLCAALCALGYLGLIVDAAGAPYVWVTALGLGQGVAVALALGHIVDRARDHHVAHLSTMAQSAGYLVASAGPFLIGVLHGLTSSWTVPLLVLLTTLFPLLVAGRTAARVGHVLPDST